MRRLSIAVIALAGSLSACVQGQGTNTSWKPIPRPAPDDPTPAGIAYTCDNQKEVTVVYAKNRASVTLDKRTWRLEYQDTGEGFRYSDATAQWVGRDDLVTLRESANTARPIAYNCRPTRRTT